MPEDKTPRPSAQRDLAQTRELLMRQLVAAQERERSRIARELHDQLGQHIVALSLGLGRLSALVSEGEAQDLITLMRRVADLMGRDVHTLAMELRPSALDHLGLDAAVRAYAEQIADRAGFEIDLHCEPVPETAGATLQTGLYRITQEALTNVVKHARAQRVSLILECRGDELLLIVEDDGRGFEVPKLDHGDETSRLGLAGMRERAALLGGTLTIESAPGNGASVYVRVPLRSEGASNEQKAPTAAR